MGAYRDKDAQAVEFVRARMTRPIYDGIATAVSSLFIEEFIHAGAGRPGDLSDALVRGLWPIHPFDDAFARLGRFFDAQRAPGGALHAAVEWACSELGADARVAELAACDAAAEAIGGTSRAWANDAGWKAANFVAVERDFLSMPAEATAPFDTRGGIVCCLNFATFLFSMGRAVAASTPGIDAPFIWDKQDYAGFVFPFEGEDAPSEPWRARGVDTPRFVQACGRLFGVRALHAEDDVLRGCAPAPAGCGDARTDAAADAPDGPASCAPAAFASGGAGASDAARAFHPCTVRDPLALALDIADAVVPGAGVACGLAEGCEDGGAFDAFAAADAVERAAFELAAALGCGALDACERARAAFAADKGVCGGSVAPSRRLRHAVGLATLCCCMGSGREDPAAYCRRRLGHDIGLREEAWDGGCGRYGR